MFRARPNLVRPSEVSAKVQNRSAARNHDPGNYCPRSATPRHDRARPNARAGSNASRPRNSSAYHADAPSDPGNYVPRPAEISSANFTRPTTAADHASVRPRPFRLGHIPDCPADRPARPSQRRGRPEALFEAQTYVFKPGLTLAASRKT
ncbi:unnamed protein product [Microthlaspi erraticum]|uniref:Uncharacterized protein n=1 Tax=Microthlaspi erraticum TaxID=1685480 RepID=A0A6D2I0A6_9BRAS|nr:unnamed protein product [Microthlaspi erraticum]